MTNSSALELKILYLQINMIKIRLSVLLIFATMLNSPAQIRVSDNQKFLVDKNG